MVEPSGRRHGRTYDKEDVDYFRFLICDFEAKYFNRKSKILNYKSTEETSRYG